MPKVHWLLDYSDGEVYDLTQYSDDVDDGDVLVCNEADGPHVVILNRAWPSVVNDPNNQVFHRLAPGYDWETVEDGRYSESYRIAQEIIKNLP